MSEDGFIQQAQPLSLSDEENPFQTTSGPAHPAKRPRPNFDEEEEEDLLPLLSDFFADFEVSVSDQISICRTFASHLAACVKSQKKKK